MVLCIGNCFLFYLFIIMLEVSMLNEWLVLFLPAVLYALCPGCAPLKQCYNAFLLSYSFVGDTEATLDQVKVCVDLF